MMKRIVLLTLLAACVAPQALAQSAVFVVRHAERADDGAAALEDDPDLAAAGRARAEALAATLKDAGITAIYATQYKRTHQTAAPLAKALGLTIVTVHSDDITGLVEQVRKAKGNVLVVSHSGSVPKFLKALGASSVPELGHDDYDNLFIVTNGERPRMVRLHFR
jgi:broad specificity phosphatase PhoE